MRSAQTPVQIIGAGLGGLVAAITAAERGAQVTVLEGHAEVGGRWRVSRGAYAMHEGPHVMYRDGPIWAWLAERSLLGTPRTVPTQALGRFRFRVDGRLRRRPPAELVRVLVSRAQAPVDQSYADWAGDRYGERAAQISASASGVGVFHPRPGELSAAFVQQRLRRVFTLPPQAGYRQGGWGCLLNDLAEHARRLGVVIKTGERVNEIADRRTIVATSLPAAAVLLNDPSLTWPSGQVALLDLGLRRGPRDAFVVSDLDEGGWLEDFSVPDPTVAPPGGAAVQLQVPLGDGEGRAAATARLEALADLALPRWRDRVELRRDAVARGRTGAVDHPGRTWRNRPAIDRGNGVYLVGDQVAAPGWVSEVSFTRARWAAELATPNAPAFAGRSRRPNAPAPRDRVLSLRLSRGRTP